MLKKKSWLVTAAFAVAFGGVAQAAWQPSKPVEFVVTSSPGGGTDNFARMVQSIIAKHKLMDQSVVVTNKGGGSGGPNFNGDGNGRPGGAGGALRRWLPWVIAGAFIAVFFVPALMKGGDGDEMTYSDFMALVQAGEVQSVTVQTGSSKITGVLEDGTKFVTHGGGDRGLSEADEAILREEGVELTFDPPDSNWLLGLLSVLLPVLLIIGFFVWMQRRAQGQSGGPSHRPLPESNQTVKLSPQPQAPLALGLSKTKPAAKSSSFQSIVEPTR